MPTLLKQCNIISACRDATIFQTSTLDLKARIPPDQKILYAQWAVQPKKKKLEIYLYTFWIDEIISCKIQSRYSERLMFSIN